MSSQSIKYRARLKLRRFHPLLPKHFRGDNIATEPSEDRGLSAASPGNTPSPSAQLPNKNPAACRNRRAEIVEQRMRNLELQRSKLFNELFQMEDQHQKKDSVRARLSSIQSHLEQLESMSVKAKALMTFESSLLARLNSEIATLQSPLPAITTHTEEPIAAIAPRYKTFICTDVSGILAVVEVGNVITAHLNLLGQKCSIEMPTHLIRLNEKKRQKQLEDHLSLESWAGHLSLKYRHSFIEGETAILVVLQGFPYPVACLTLRETSPTDILIEIKDKDVEMSLIVPSSRLNLPARLHLLSSAIRKRLHQTLQANLLVQRKAGAYTLIYKTYSYHLSRLVTKTIPGHGEFLSIRVFPDRSHLRQSAHEYALGEVKLQAREDEVTIVLAVDSLAEQLRLQFVWKQGEVYLREEVDTEVFAFLKGLQFHTPRESPITLLKSLEMLSSLKPQLAALFPRP